MTTAYVRAELPAFRELAEPQLAFGDRHQTRGIDSHPLRGLVAHGPFSGALLAGFKDTIRLAIVAPQEELGVARRIVDELRAAHKPQERPDYLVDYPGFRAVFDVDISVAGDDANVAFLADLDNRLHAASDPRQVIVDAVEAAVSAAARNRSAFDVLVVRLPARWSPWFRGPDDFDLRHSLKAAAARRGIATQIILDDALNYADRCSVAWRLAIALYTKGGGVPWKLAETRPGTAYVGIGYALRSAHAKRFVRCVAQVFDDRGAGLEFVGYTATEEDGTRIDGDNPYLNRRQMHAVLARGVQLYQAQHQGALPQRVVVHKTTPFTTLETEGAFDALGRVPDVELIQVQQDTPWRGVRGTGDGQPDSWPVLRGTLINLSDRDLLLWTQGNAPAVARRGNYYKEGRGVPHPVVLTRFAGHGDAEEVASEVLALSKMDWNNDALYDPIPVTIQYSQLLARTIAKATSLPSGVYPYRLFM